MRLRTLIVTFVSSAVLVACATSDAGHATGSAEDEAAIRQLAEDWAAKYNAHDATGIAAMMSADYHEVAPTGEHMSSPAEAQAMMERDLAGMPPGASVSLTTEFVQFLDADDAFAGGTYQMAGTPEGMPNRGSWLVVFSKDSTGWKMRSGMGSTDLSFMMAAEPAANPK